MEEKKGRYYRRRFWARMLYEVVIHWEKFRCLDEESEATYEITVAGKELLRFLLEDCVDSVQKKEIEEEIARFQKNNNK